MGLTSAEFQWVFMKIRNLSVGSTVHATLRCGDSDSKNEISATIDLSSFKIVSTPRENKVMINDDLGFMMKDPTVRDIIKEQTLDEEYSVIATYIDYVFDTEDTYPIQGESDEEIKGFIDSLPPKTLEEISKYAKDADELVLEKKWKCPKCGHENVTVVRGINAFFQ
jgi:hypothetical protein